MRPLITLTSDFAVQSQGVGVMEAVILGISPDANVVHLMHGLPSFDLVTAARALETVSCLQPGFHVCVVDPGVGTLQRRIIVQTERGDFLIGPDNGVLLPAAKLLGGCVKVFEITNTDYMRHPVSPIFHGRDIFSPAAAHLSVGVPVEDFGKELNFADLASAPYDEAFIKDGEIHAQVIHVNKYGSVVLNILPSLFDDFGVSLNDSLVLQFGDVRVELPFVFTFGDVGKGRPLILSDDYGRVEVAVNLGDFSQAYDVKVGDGCIITRSS